MKRFLSAILAVAFSAVAAYGITVSGINSSMQNQTVKVGFLSISPLSGITARAGGGQALATQLVDGINRVTVVATAADSVKLPKATAGLVVIVINADSADALAVFPTSGDAINALSPDAVLSVAANKTIVFFCAVDGTWNSLLTA